MMSAVLSLSLPASVYATTAQDEICMGVNVDDAGCAAADDSSLRGIIHAAINLFSVTIAIVAVVMIIYAGFRYVTSEGDNSQIAAAKNTLLYAVVGIVIVAMAQLIVRFVVDNVA
jgi:uncharacterized membrane protein YidH (DUF202 family)